MKLPTTPLARRIAALARRRPTTLWSDKEYDQFRRLYKAGCFNDLNAIALVERFYEAQWKRGKDGTHRRDLLTILNNWQGENDKANDWASNHPMKPSPRKVIPMPLLPSEPYVAPTDPESVERIERFMSDLAARKKARTQ